MPVKNITKGQLEEGRLLYPEEVERPTKRAECAVGTRPCPFVGCKYNNYLDINPESGTIKFNFPDLEPGEITDSCTLDIAGEGGLTLEQVADVMNITRERVRQIEGDALAELRRRPSLKKEWD